MSTSALTSQTETTNEFQEKKITNIFANDAETSQPMEKNDSDSTQSNVNPCFLTSKLCWIQPNTDQLEQLNADLKNKLVRGNNETLISLGEFGEEKNGLTKEEMSAAINTLNILKDQLNCSIRLLRERKANANVSDSNAQTTATVHHGSDKEVSNTETHRFINDYFIRKNISEDDFIDVRVAVVGNVDSGKSTMLGVLTHGVLDDGRGEARTKLFRHKHEIESGRTSSVGNDILGFDASGNVVNDSIAQSMRALDWEMICKSSSKVITFIDLAGHEKYLKTTVFGMTGHAPDFCMLIVGSNMGIVGMTKEHLGLALSLNLPVFVALTKIDMCPPNVYQDTLKVLQKILKSPGCRKIAYMVENYDDMITCALNFQSERLCPIFPVSNVTGQNLDLLKGFLNLLNTRMDDQTHEPAEFQIDEIYSVPGVGTVVSGTCYKGRIQMNDTLLLGPDLIGQFRPVIVKGVHRKRMPVKEVRSGQTASFALKKIKRSELRKGMYLLSEKLHPSSSWEFEGEILVLHHPTTISVNYQAMVHCGSIRQTATILDMSVQHLRTGDKANVKFRFIKNPEFLKIGQKMIFREGRTKAVGTITRVEPIKT